MQIPPPMVPLLEEVVQSPLLKGFPLEIWRAKDHRSWVDAFLVFGCALYNSDIPEEGLPHGYIQAAYLFDWESQCQLSGWYAFENRSETIDRVLESYDEIGLSAESKALSAALKAWQGSEGSHEATSEAYNELRHEYSVDLDRLEHMVCYFIDNADTLFYVRTET
jgi:hypothetical protein